MTRKITIIGLVAVAGVLGVYDIFVASNDVPNDTITEVIASGGAPIAFVIGIIGGHLFWPRKGR